MTSSLCPDQLQLLRFYEFFLLSCQCMGYTQNIKERKGHFSCYCFCQESISSKQLREWSYSSPEGVGFESRVEGF